MKIAICDDEARDRERYAALFRKTAQENHIPLEIAFYEKGEQILFAWADTAGQADILFLDIHLPGISGFALAQKLRAADCHRTIVFLTRDDSYLKKAFDVGACHYILKREMSDERIADIFLRACAKAGERQREYLLVGCAGESRDIPLDEIGWFEVRDHIITVYYGQKSFAFYSTMDKLEQMLPDQDFLRVHRAYLVRRSFIHELSGGEVLLKNGLRIKAGRAYIRKLREALLDEAGES